MKYDNITLRMESQEIYIETRTMYFDEEAYADLKQRAIGDAVALDPTIDLDTYFDICLDDVLQNWSRSMNYDEADVIWKDSLDHPFSLRDYIQNTLRDWLQDTDPDTEWDSSYGDPDYSIQR